MVLSTGEVTLSQRMGEAGKKAMTGMEMRLVNVPSDGGAGHGLFENLHGFANGGELSEHLRNAAATYYGTPARAFLEQLVPAGADGQVRYVGGRFAVVSIAGEWRLRWASCRAKKAMPKRRACVASRIGWAPVAPPGPAKSRTASGPSSNFWNCVDRAGSRKSRRLRVTRLRLGSAPSCLMRTSQKSDWMIERVNNMAGHKQRDGKRTVFMISQEVWKNEVCKGMDADLVAKAIDEKGWLLHDTGHYTKLKRLSGQDKRLRLYHVTSDILAAEQEDEQSDKQE